MRQYESFKCAKCQMKFFDENEAGAEDGVCGPCRGKIECEECGRWVGKVNKKKLCIECIPRYIKYSSVMAAVNGEVIGDYYSGVSSEEKIEVISGLIDCILDNLPKEISDKVLTYRKLDYKDMKDKVFIKDEDKL